MYLCAVGAQVKIPLERYKFVKNPLAQRFDLKNQQGIHVSDVAIRNHLQKNHALRRADTRR